MPSTSTFQHYARAKSSLHRTTASRNQRQISSALWYWTNGLARRLRRSSHRHVKILVSRMTITVVHSNSPLAGLPQKLSGLQDLVANAWCNDPRLTLKPHLHVVSFLATSSPRKITVPTSHIRLCICTSSWSYRIHNPTCNAWHPKHIRWQTAENQIACNCCYFGANFDADSNLYRFCVATLRFTVRIRTLTLHSGLMDYRKLCCRPQTYTCLNSLKVDSLIDTAPLQYNAILPLQDMGSNRNDSVGLSPRQSLQLSPYFSFDPASVITVSRGIRMSAFLCVVRL